jgi:serine protease Do
MHRALPAALFLIATAAAAEPILTGPAPTAPAGRDWNLRQTPVVDVVKRSKNAVVNIHSERMVKGMAAEDLFALSPSQNRVNGMGTGVVIDPRGYIITNQHVVEDVNTIRVRLADGTTLSAKVLARDLENDLALLKVDPEKPLPVVPLGTASDLMVGETVVAIGNAYGYEHTVSVGVVSAVGRDVVLNKEVSYKQLIQTDASINPGNSGGPLLNINGELIGLNVAIRAGAQGIGFAIPVDSMIRSATAMMESRRDGGPAGLALKDEVHAGHDDGSWQRNVIVERVEAGGLAAKAGLQRGDVIAKVGDQPVASSLDVERGLLDHANGEHVAVVVKRSGAEQKVELTMEATRPAGGVVPAGADLVWRRLGVRLQPVTADAVAGSTPPLHGGLLVADIRPESAAVKAGIKKGDVLFGLHQWEMLTQDNVLFVLNNPDLSTFNPMRYFVLRGGQVHRGLLSAE